MSKEPGAIIQGKDLFQSSTAELAGLLTSNLGFAVLADPIVGTGSHGHTYPGATIPFGMVQLSPDTRLTGWDGCSAYHYSDNYIYGFSHTHLSGTGCSDYGDILLMPLSIPLDPPETKPSLENGADGEAGYRSRFDHSSETVLPGFYSVYLDDHDIGVRLTATRRCGFHHYSYPEGRGEAIVIDLAHRDKVIDSAIYINSSTEISGFRRSRAWAEDQHVYFVARFSRPIVRHALSIGGDPASETVKEISGEDLRGWFTFDPGDGGVLFVKVGISAVSIEGARGNLDAELPDWDFNETAREALAEWDRSLSRIIVKGGNTSQKRTFYSALYHSLLAPNLYSDVDGRYRGRDLKIHSTDDFEYYTVFSLWDTYRAAHPLFTIIEPERTVDFMKTFLRQYKEGGALPVWELGANETGCMIGYHAVPVIADAYIKGIDDFDSELALEAMISSASQDHLGLESYKANGFIASEDAGQSVSRTLEYAYDDWCIAMMARAMGRADVEAKFLRRAQSYKNLFDPATGFMRARLNGAFIEPFDPAEVNFHYTEANSWQYSFYVPQDISGLAMLHGGMAELEAKLDSLFAQRSDLKGLDQPDVTGLIGQYAHGNEPSQHMAYLYNYTGSPWKTQRRVREIIDTMYGDKPDGLCGNEDCGQMSSWYVLSALGFYPVTPGDDIYIIGSPLFDKAEIELSDGKSFIVSARRDTPESIYIRSATLNGKKYDRSFISHRDIVHGGALELELGPEPSYSWGMGKGNVPISRIEKEIVCPSPVIDTSGRIFTGSLTLSFSCAENEAEIRYTTDGSEPGPESRLYGKPFTITETSTIKAAAYKTGMIGSRTLMSHFTRIKEGIFVKLTGEYSPLYSGGGPLALVDQIRGGEDFRTGGWQGYQGIDLEAVIDLGKEIDIKKISAGFMNDPGAWIFLPVRVGFAVSSDGESFSDAGEIENPFNEEPDDEKIWEARSKNLSVRARYVRVRAENIGVCPPGHPGEGSRSWIFIDEITVDRQ
ncbi:MAG: GH92 family glycosyl hydrolase [Candidatus Krumholzibacteriota bacterium]|nr:GH92 family glycosyl hydrolase [Candidatus Krumholzibacteriota bacterium]